MCLTNGVQFNDALVTLKKVFTKISIICNICIIKKLTLIGSSKEKLLFRELLVGVKQSINSRTRPGVFILKLSRDKRQLPL